MSAAKPGRICLGGALWGAQPAPGHASPTQQAPDAWLAALASAVDAGSHERLCRASRGSRAWVHKSAPRARVTLTTASNARSRKHVSEAATVLAGRGGLKSTVTVVLDSPVDAAGSVGRVADVLAGGGPGITSVIVRYDGSQAEHAGPAPDVSTFVASLAAACPRLYVLQFRDVAFTLPAPTQLRSLTEVSLVDTGSLPDPCIAAMCSSVVTVIGQLTALHIQTRDGAASAAPLSLVFPAAAAPQPPLNAAPTTTLSPLAPSLASLATNVQLDDTALRLLVTHAPGLTHLKVGALYVLSDIQPPGVLQSDTEGSEGREVKKKSAEGPGDGQSDATKPRDGEPNDAGLVTWTVQHLEVVSAVEMAMLGRLPYNLACESNPPQPTAVVCPELTITMGDEGDLTLPGPTRYFYTAKKVTVQAHGHLPIEEHPLALEISLLYLSEIRRTPGTVSVTLSDWQLSADTAQEAADILASVPAAYSFSAHIGTLTDAALGALLVLAPRVRRVSVGGIQLQSGQYANVPWPWEGVEVSRLHAAALARLPDPRRATAAGPASLAFFEMTVMGMPEVTPMNSDTPVCITIDHWPMTTENMQALAWLPRWASAVRFMACSWPLEAYEYQRLAQYIPPCYDAWAFQLCTFQGDVCEHMPPSLYESVCAGIAQYRPVQYGPVDIEASGYGPMWELEGSEGRVRVRAPWGHKIA